MLEKKPILITCFCAVAIVVGVYLLGQYNLEKNRIPYDTPVTAKDETNNALMTGGGTGGSLVITESGSQSKERVPQELEEPPGNNHTEGHHTDTHSGEITSEVTTVARYTKGPYKGLTYEQAQEVYEWRLRKRKLQREMIEQSKKVRANARALVASADEELSLIRSAFKLMSPEELEAVRQAALNELSTAVVEEFFSDFANHSTIMTPEEIVEREAKMFADRKLLWIASDKLDADFNQLVLEMDEHDNNYPNYPQ